jgi:trimethylamine--corrinoid protein Co-methyltransferase
MTQKIKPISDPKLSLNILTDREISQIHEATLEVLETTGVKFPSTKALEVLEEAGAQVSRDDQVAKIPSRLVNAALESAPGSYLLAGLDPSLDLPLDGNHSYLATDGCGVEIIDAFSGERRRTTKADVSQVARVADYLEAISFHWVPVSAQDCPPETRGLHELQAVWNSSRKHVQTESIVHAEEMRAAVEMASILAGGSQALKERPALSITQCTLSPLAHDGGSLEAGLIAAQAGLPVGFMTMASCATTGPVTLAGNLVVGNAEVLSALVLMQMAYPGSPFYYAAAQTAADLRTGGYTGGGPEDYLFGAVTNRLADFYDLPLSMGAFATGAKQPDWQAAVDNSLSSFMAVSTLSDMLLGAGLLDGSRIFSYEMLLMDAEIWSILHAMFQGIVIDQDTLALDVIKQVGPGGNYLGQSHTRQHMRRRWLPELMDRRPFSLWETHPEGAREWARQRARQILQEHNPAPLEPNQDAELSRVIASLESD